MEFERDASKFTLYGSLTFVVVLSPIRSIASKELVYIAPSVNMVGIYASCHPVTHDPVIFGSPAFSTSAISDTDSAF